MTAVAAKGRGSGKIILTGEHAVVYGVKGIAAGIARGAHAHVELSDGPESRLTLGDRTVAADENGDDLARAFAALLGASAAGPPVVVNAVAEIPPGGGLGCSAALSVAIARAIDAAWSLEPDDQRVFERGMAWERVYHGNPSGIDTAAAMAGTFLVFERNVGHHTLYTAHDVWLAVAYSGSSASTKLMVDGVARIRTSRPELFEKFLNGVKSITDNAVYAIDAADAQTLGKLMDYNQMLLAGMMLSTDTIETMCKAARDAGALGAKLTGSGGGGSVIALGGMCPRGEANSEAERLANVIAERWSTAGFSAFATRIAATPAAGGVAPQPSDSSSEEHS
ncbi:MAG: mevalonate kinase [Polyangiaceae bacterium]